MDPYRTSDSPKENRFVRTPLQKLFRKIKWKTIIFMKKLFASILKNKNIYTFLGLLCVSAFLSVLNGLGRLLHLYTPDMQIRDDSIWLVRNGAFCIKGVMACILLLGIGLIAGLLYQVALAIGEIIYNSLHKK